MLRSPHVEGIQDSLMDSGPHAVDCGFHVLDSRLFSVQVGLWIPIVSAIPDSLSCILDSKSQDSGCLTSLRSKRFRLVSEQKKTVERDFRFCPRDK